MAGFDFNDARPLPFLSAPASPRRFGDLTLSAPTSPGRVADFYRSFENFSEYDGGGVPFHWEEIPGTLKSPKKLPSSKSSPKAPNESFSFSGRLLRLTEQLTGNRPVGCRLTEASLRSVGGKHIVYLG
ncbi:unnamed protein product [Linum trigynum]|uniref:Uncharacterized protein n=1 Tax=Linum trigynum TaxID=586398 RepID=A0AAV2DS34_9ROSI